MSVIGRLDKQLEDILITPLSKTRPPQDKVPRGEQPETEPAETTRETERTENQKRAEPSSLPVWLL